MRYLLLALLLFSTAAYATHNNPPDGALENDSSRAGHYFMPPNGSTFPIPSCGATVDRSDGLHYITNRAEDPLTGTVSLTFSIQGTGELVPTEGTGPKLALYFQRRGDDWTASGKYAAYRWWSKTRVPLTLGMSTTISVPLQWDLWGPVMTTSYNTAANFDAARNDPRRVGFTLGGSVGAGHGVCMKSGSANFTLTTFSH